MVKALTMPIFIDNKILARKLVTVSLLSPNTFTDNIAVCVSRMQTNSDHSLYFITVCVCFL